MWDPYAILGVSRDAGPDEIREAYHRLARLHHPDVHAATPEQQRQAEARMTDLNLAYRDLRGRDPRRPREAPLRGPQHVPLCPDHTADMVYQCPRCRRPACGRCLTGRGCVRCPRPAPAHLGASGGEPVPHQLGPWLPVALGLLLMRFATPPPADIGWGAVVYLALVAVVSTVRARRPPAR